MNTLSLSHGALAVEPAKPVNRWRQALRARSHAPDSDLFATRLHMGRELRVAANFSVTQDEALWLYRRLRDNTRLSEEQVQLLKPVDATPRRFAQRRHAWDSLRPLTHRTASGSSWAALPPSSVLGLPLGLALGIGWLAGLSIVESLLAAVLGTLLLLGVSLVLRPVLSSAAQHRRFDRVLQRRLARGQYAVVVTGVQDATAATQAIAAMRSVGIYWCAETPRTTH